VKTSITGLWAIGAGRTDERREGMLGSKPLATLIERLRRRFTRILVEFPSADDAAEAIPSAASADVTLVPVMRSRTRRRALKSLLARLSDTGAKAVRTVFLDV
jgi:hypothetical protein